MGKKPCRKGSGDQRNSQVKEKKRASLWFERTDRKDQLFVKKEKGYFHRRGRGCGGKASLNEEKTIKGDLSISQRGKTEPVYSGRETME